MVKLLRIEKRSDQLHIDGYPDAVALKQIGGQVVSELKMVTLHHSDLSFCQEALAEISRLDSEKQRLLTDALWIASIARYFKCFGKSKSRTHLSSKEVLKGHVGAEDVFSYFKALRDKHIIHDENPYSQAFVGVALNRRETRFKIADIISVAINAFTVDDDHFVQFSKLVGVTLAWVKDKRDELHNRLGKMYEQWNYEDLLGLPDIKYTAPTSKEVRIKR